MKGAKTIPDKPFFSNKALCPTFKQMPITMQRAILKYKKEQVRLLLSFGFKTDKEEAILSKLESLVNV